MLLDDEDMNGSASKMSMFRSSARNVASRSGMVKEDSNSPGKSGKASRNQRLNETASP